MARSEPTPGAAAGTVPAVSDPAAPLIARSWQRSIETHRLDPGRNGSPRVLAAGALREHREPMEPLLAVARSGMESLFQQVRDAGYVVLLTNAQGVSVDFMTNPVLDRELRRSGLYLGSCWQEEFEGTCAVALCTIDKQSITVHRGEHFRASNQSLTCSAAPLMAPDGTLLGVLDASALSSPDDKRSQHLVLQMVRHTAAMIEAANFLREFERHWVLRIHARREFLEVATEGLLALDGAGFITAANGRFLHQMGCSARSLVGRNVEDVFGMRFDLIAGAVAHGAATPLALRLLQSGSQCFALVRPPRRDPARGALRDPGLAKRAAQGDGGAALVALAGGDPRMAIHARQALRVIGKGIPVLLHGESGTGKEAFAKAMHDASPRAGQAFVALNCAAIPESLIESELFGYREGAFTGARAKGARGKIEQAHGGTLFFDEIGDMPLSLQTRLLRVLAEREVMPLGAEQPVPVDLQVICATHRDVMELVHAGQFRLDLYYRLSGLVLTLPPLRDRQDKVRLFDALLQEEARSMGRKAPHLSGETLAMLIQHDWPGNIRELKNALRLALALCDEQGVVELEHLPANIVGSAQTMRSPAQLAETVHEAPTAQSVASERVVSADSVQREALVDALRRHHWNVTRASRELRICRATLYRQMQRFEIVVPNKREW